MKATKKSQKLYYSELNLDLFNYQILYKTVATTQNSTQLSFIDLFAGIGGIKIAFEQAGFNCVFSNDFDKDCKKTYDFNFAKNNQHQLYLEDISLIAEDTIPNGNILTAGFPCQPFSIAGYRQGFDDKKGRGNVFFDIIRIMKKKEPQVFLLENVKNLKTHDSGKTIKIIYQELKNLGYSLCDKVMNAMDYGNIPQNRERIYIVGFRNINHFNNFQFPEKIPLTKKISDCLETEVAEKYYYNNKPLFERISGDINKKNTLYQWRRKYVRENKNSVCPTLTANMGMGGHNVPIILDEKGIRKLTPRECANFQGFPADYKLPQIADSALYKQFGNSVAISVVKRIAENIKIAISSDNH